MFFLLGVAEMAAFLVLFLSLDVFAKLNPPESVGVHLVTLAVVHLYPVMGFIVDTCVSRYKVILVCLLISLVGAAIIAIAFLVIDPFFEIKMHTYPGEPWEMKDIAAMSLGFLLIIYDRSYWNKSEFDSIWN